MKVVIAPNTFKGSLSAPEAAAAIARGVREAFPDAEVVEIPVADGGDGTVEALVSAHRGEYRTVQVEGPLVDPVQATSGLIEPFINSNTMNRFPSASGMSAPKEAAPSPL